MCSRPRITDTTDRTQPVVVCAQSFVSFVMVGWLRAIAVGVQLIRPFSVRECTSASTREGVACI